MTKPKNKNQGSNNFSNAVLRTMIASDPAVSYASGWNWSNNGVTQRRTKESDQLADNLVTVALSAPISPETILAEKVVGSAAKYGAGVYSRYKFAHTPLAPVGKVTRVLRKYLPEIGHSSKRNFYTEPDAFNKQIGENLFTTKGGVMASPGITTEMHFTPAVTYKLEGDVPTIISTAPRESSRRVGQTILKNLPSKTVIASDGEARAIPQILKDQPLKDRVLYYLAGRNPKLPTTNVDGYSTDIMEILARASKRNNGIVTPSLTTKIEGTNILGKSYNKYSKYFPESNKEFVKFSDMTPEQVKAWNTEVAPNLGVQIDPETRLADHLMYITK